MRKAITVVFLVVFSLVIVEPVVSNAQASRQHRTTRVVRRVDPNKDTSGNTNGCVSTPNLPCMRQGKPTPTPTDDNNDSSSESSSNSGSATRRRN